VNTHGSFVVSRTNVFVCREDFVVFSLRGCILMSENMTLLKG